MVITKERVTQDIAKLNESQLQQIAEFLEFLKFRENPKHLRAFDESEIAKLYQEFGEEDRELSENNLSDFVENLKFEDTKK